MRLLVTGCGRSGTTWMAAALRSTGIDCGHERAFSPGYGGSPARWGEGGWAAEVSGHAAPFTPLPGTYVVRLVRHPLKVITSAVRRGGGHPRSRAHVLGALPELRPHTGDVIEYTARYWVAWNALVAADETLRIEDVTADDITRLGRIADPDAGPAAPPERRLNATRPRGRPVTWDQVSHVPGLVEATERYGYL